MAQIKLRINELMAEKSVRDGVELTATDVARAIGVSHNTILAYIRGQAQQPNMSVLARLIAYFECEPGDLFEYTPENNTALPEFAW